VTLVSVCPKCGEPSSLGLCDQCRLEMATLLECPDRVEVTLCPVCGSHLVRGRWQDSQVPVEDLISDAVAEAIGLHKDLKDPEVDLSWRRGEPPSTWWLST